jgi:hypothetical protein
MSEQLILAHFFERVSKMGDIECLFITTEKKLAAQMGRKISLGDALGKHSDIIVEMDTNNTEIISRDQENIKWLQGLQITGPNWSTGQKAVPIGWNLVEESEWQRAERGEDPEEADRSPE